MFGWGGLVVSGAPIEDFGRLRIAGLGAEAIARRERSLALQPDGRIEARVTLRPADRSLPDTVRAASRAAPGGGPRTDGARDSTELRRLADADIVESAVVRIDPATGVPIDMRIERATRAPGLFEQREDVSVRRRP
jgi:hypothetical protein